MGNSNDAKKDPHQLSEEQINSLMQSTSFSRDEIVQWHAGFIKDCIAKLYTERKRKDIILSNGCFL